MTILVVGGTGMVGAEAVRQLAARGAAVRVMSRSPERAAALPKGVEGVVGDLAEPDSLPAAFAGATGLLLTTALGPAETRDGLAAVEAAKAARVRQVVYMTVHRLLDGGHIPHFASKVPVVQAIKDSGIGYAFLEPNNFYQNDLWFEAAITRLGLYPQPLGPIGLNRVDVRDIAEAAANALLLPGHEGKAYPLIGPEALTGAMVAAAFGRQLGREVRYGGDDLDAWAEEARETMPEWLVRDLKIMYRHFIAHGLLATDDDLTRCEEVLGHPPRTFEPFVAEVVARWRR
jgi:uncharacterized protein YbjT (DUF2867 family)